MADKSSIIVPTFYNEDVSVLGTGTVLVSRPGVIWTLIACIETSGVVVISFSDDNTGYTNAHRIGKLVFNGPSTSWNDFAKGLNLIRGLSCTSNIASVDVWGVVD